VARVQTRRRRNCGQEQKKNIYIYIYFLTPDSQGKLWDPPSFTLKRTPEGLSMVEERPKRESECLPVTEAKDDGTEI
jgi:hypothetical protein